MTKQALRTYYKKKREEITAADRKEWDLKICQRVINSIEFQRAEQILCYMSFGSEVATTAIIEEGLKQGKEMYLPRVAGVRQMDFYQVGKMNQAFSEDCQPGAYGILEPASFCEVFSYQKGRPFCMLLPGLAFDAIGNRLGYGAAYYDSYQRTLFSIPDFDRRDFSSIGICYGLQIAKELPREEHDILLDRILTEEGYYL